MQIARPALLVIDIPFAKDVVAQINDLIAFAREQDMPIAYTQHGHPDPHADEKWNVMVGGSDLSARLLVIGGRLQVLGGKGKIRCPAAYIGADDVIRKGSKAWRMMPEVEVGHSEGDLLIHKEVYDCFGGTPSLESFLAEKSCDGLIICGVCTNDCDETTARSAVCRQILIVLVKDAVSTYTKEMHMAALKSVEWGFGQTLTTDEIKTRWQDKRSFEVRRPPGLVPPWRKSPTGASKL